jgi:hypothetical protein
MLKLGLRPRNAFSGNINGIFIVVCFAGLNSVTFLMFARAGILFVVREVLPVAASWRYEKPGEREQILQLSLAAVLQYVTAVPEGDKIKSKRYT